MASHMLRNVMRADDQQHIWKHIFGSPLYKKITEHTSKDQNLHTLL